MIALGRSRGAGAAVPYPVYTISPRSCWPSRTPDLRGLRSLAWKRENRRGSGERFGDDLDRGAEDLPGMPRQCRFVPRWFALSTLLAARRPLRSLVVVA